VNTLPSLSRFAQRVEVSPWRIRSRFDQRRWCRW
jgi:hypothetical protein